MFSAATKSDSQAAAATGYQVSRSLRFNSADSTYLTRTPASTGSTIWTVSCWHKRAELGLSHNVGISARSSSNTDATINIGSGDDLGWARNGTFTSTGVLIRDLSAWYHFVTTYDNTNIRMYVNGVLVYTAATSSLSRINNSTVVQHIGSRGDGTSVADGYTAEFYFIDGQALTPSSFGETDSVTGVWVPKEYTGTYGTNGFYLDFSDNSGTTSSTLGKDRSGNNNDWTPTNFSVAADYNNDSMIDSPTSYSDGGTGRGNYCTLNPLDTLTTSTTLSNGNLFYTGTGAAVGNFWMPSGKWYWEIQKLVNAGNSNSISVGIRNTVNSFSYTTATNASLITIGLRFDADAGTLDYTLNGSSWTSISTGLTSGPYTAYTIGSSGTPWIGANFGQQPFVYTPPTGYKALNTFNLPDPTIVKGTDHFDAVTYSGTGSSRSISGIPFSPDLVWIKQRNAITDHQVFDTTRGATKVLPIGTASESTVAQSLTAFNSDGFTVGTNTNVNSGTGTYVAWNWNESVTAGIDIVSYTGNATNRTIAHNLGVAPRMILVKNVNNGGQHWWVYHASQGATKYLQFSANNAATTSATAWNNTAPTSTVFTVGTAAQVNGNTNPMIAYLFAQVEGFSRFGTYTGNGSATNGPFIWCGFRPAFVMFKNTSAAGSWATFDNTRNSSNLTNLKLVSNSTGVESTDTSTNAPIDILSNGFKLRGDGGDGNTSTNSYIFAAFAESPFKYALAR